jgi:hypothetical protein
MAAMVALMFRLGVGTLAPIAFVVGGVILLAAGIAGGGMAAALKKS